MKIVINRSHGGFGLSEEAYKYLGLDWDGYGDKYADIDSRTDPKLIECVETLGEVANGESAELKIVEIPDDVDWEIEEYEGKEHIAERHRTWY